jgi:XTP/dITP diphosphohydrolase
VFIPEGYKQSFAELGDAIKSELSHRAKAVLALRGSL